MSVIIYHNPRCTKSRLTLELLREKGFEPEIVEYLKSPLEEEEIKKILGYLGKSASEVIRKGEDIYKEKKLKLASDQELTKAMADTPILIERPIVVNGQRAAIGRPPENVLEIL